MTRVEILKFLESRKEVFFKKYGVTKIGIFGSYAKDKAKETSDIDIFAEMPPKFDNFVKLQEELEKELRHKVDLIRLREKMNPRLKENILKDGLYV